MPLHNEAKVFKPAGVLRINENLDRQIPKVFAFKHWFHEMGLSICDVEPLPARFQHSRNLSALSNIEYLWEVKFFTSSTYLPTLLRTSAGGSHKEP